MRCWTHFLPLLASSGSVLAANAPINVTLPATPPNSSPVNVVYDNFLGISIELAAFDTLWGYTNETLPNAMLNYLSNIRARMKNPLRIRIGGNSMDAATYVPTQGNMITLTDPNAYFNDIPVNFGPKFWDVLNAMANKVGEMQYIIGLSMEDPSAVSNVVEIAAAAEQQLGSRLDAMLLGNEPDLYAGHGTRANYTIQDYIPEVGDVLHDFTYSSDGNLVANKIIGGPSICCDWDLDDILNAGLDQYPYKYYSLQHYPDNSCTGLDAQNTNISYFLTHTNVPGYCQFQKTGVDMAKKAGVPVLMTEYNTISCGGTNVSYTFAATMWAVDAGLNFASSNISGAYLHTREFNITYNLFDPPYGESNTEIGWRTGSPYYAELFVAETLSPNGSVVVDLNMDNSIYNPASTVAAYGIYDEAGKTQGKVVLINYSNDEEQNFTIPTNTTFGVGVRILTAPDVSEQNDITWAGQKIGQNGDLEGNQTTSYMHCRDGCNITVPGPGIALVLFNPRSSTTDDFYEGNSTIAGLGGYWSPSTAPITKPQSLFKIAMLIGSAFVWDLW